MLKTAEIELDGAWKRLLAEAEPRIARRISRFGRWASHRRIAPQAVRIGTIEQYVVELADATLVRKLRYVRSFVSKSWNELAASKPALGLQSVKLGGNGRVLKRIPWQSLPGSFRADAERYSLWASVPDPLDEGARARALQTAHLASAAAAPSFGRQRRRGRWHCHRAAHLARPPR